MTRTHSYRLSLLLSIVSIIAYNYVYATEAPPAVASALIIKLVAFEKNLMSNDDDLFIHVIGSSELTKALHKSIGKKIGKRKLTKVTGSDTLPSEKPDLLCVVNKSMVPKAIEYTRKEKILSITNNPELVSEGISLGVGIGSNGKPTITLNLTSSKEESLDWNPAILKIAKTIK